MVARSDRLGSTTNSRSVWASPPRTPSASTVGRQTACESDPSVTLEERSATGAGKPSSRASFCCSHKSASTCGVSGLGGRCSRPHSVALVPGTSSARAICSSRARISSPWPGSS